MSSDTFAIYCKTQIRMLRGQNLTSVRWKTQGGVDCHLVLIHGEIEYLPAARDGNAIASHRQRGGEHLLSNHLQPLSWQVLCSRRGSARFLALLQAPQLLLKGWDSKPRSVASETGSLHQTSGFETGFLWQCFRGSLQTHTSNILNGKNHL